MGSVDELLVNIMKINEPWRCAMTPTRSLGYVVRGLRGLHKAGSNIVFRMESPEAEVGFAAKQEKAGRKHASRIKNLILPQVGIAMLESMANI